MKPRPNKRLKLAGGDRFKGSGVFVPWRARTIVQLHRALRAGRPQLKRDPLGAPNYPQPCEVTSGSAFSWQSWRCY